MADEKEKKDQKSAAKDSKSKPRAKPAAKSADAKSGAAKPRARKPAASKAGAKAESKPKAESKTESKPKAEAKAESKPKAERKTKAKPAARRRAPAKKAAPAAEQVTAADAKPARGKRAAPQRPLVRAKAKYVRSSARKARLVMDHVRGRSVADARALLRHSPRGVARDVERLLNSAIANAENNHELLGDDLYVKEIYADEGPTLRRFRPRAQGRATRIRKRTSHLTVGLSTKE
jgi:ribosomal protein L22